MHPVRMVGDVGHEPRRRRVAEPQVAAVFGRQPLRVRIAASRQMVDQVEYVLAQHEGGAELRVVRTPQRMIGSIARERARSELTVADERGGAQDVTHGSDQAGVRLPAGRQAFHDVIEQAAAAVAARIDERVVVGVARALLGHFAAQIGASRAASTPLGRARPSRPSSARNCGPSSPLPAALRNEEEVEHPAAHEPVQHFAAAFAVQIESASRSSAHAPARACGARKLIAFGTAAPAPPGSMTKLAGRSPPSSADCATGSARQSSNGRRPHLCSPAWRLGGFRMSRWIQTIV